MSFYRGLIMKNRRTILIQLLLGKRNHHEYKVFSMMKIVDAQFLIGDVARLLND